MQFSLKSSLSINFSEQLSAELKTNNTFFRYVKRLLSYLDVQTRWYTF